MSQSQTSSPVTIAIVGAGPAGLILARLLQTSPVYPKITLTLFESDISPTSRYTQGGTLDLHPYTGLAAIKAAHLWDEFNKYARYEGEERIVLDKNGTELVHLRESDESVDRDRCQPEIDREKLLLVLRESVDPAVIQWGKKLASVSEDKTLNFADGTTAGPFDLIVGADGAWSKVRNLLTDVRPSYSGISGLTADILNPSVDHPHLHEIVGRGSYFVYSDGIKVTAQRMGDNSIKLGIWRTTEESWPKDVLHEAKGSDAATAEIILRHFADWADDIKALIKAGVDWKTFLLYEMPLEHTWEHKNGFTLVGDAAHLMTPFAGEGVNMAFKDCLELTNCIEEVFGIKKADEKKKRRESQILINGAYSGGLGNNDDMTNILNRLDTMTLKYETEMYPRAHKYMAETMRNKEIGMHENSAVEFLSMKIGEHAAEKLGTALAAPIRGGAFLFFQGKATLGKMRRMRKDKKEKDEKVDEKEKS
jgi:2-polyprenyl-6-methoxyphenol hydroxylase-like FAD-dependent oxidoreductase